MNIKKPTIADLTNMQHDHTSAAQGGTITSGSAYSTSLNDAADATGTAGTYYDLPTATTGWCDFKLGNSWGRLTWKADGTFVINMSSDDIYGSNQAGTAHVQIFTTGTIVRIINNLGSAKTILITKSSV